MINLFVVDTNILISAHLSKSSVSRKAFDKAREVGLPIYSKATLTEFVETFIRPKFDHYISVEKRLEAIAAFEAECLPVRVSISLNVCRDPKDNKFLELAISAGATCIITGDKDLLVLHPFEGVAILTATDFMEAF